MPETITIRGRIATTSLRRGETVTVERTDAIDRLIAGGYVETVTPATEAAPTAFDTEDEPLPQAEGAKPVEEDQAPEVEPAPAPRRPSRKRSSS